MQIIDSSSIVHAWDTYPIQQFPKLWDWLGQEVAASRLCAPEVVLTEVMHVAPACRLWLEKSGATCLPATNAILHEAARIKTLLNIGPHYARGVDMNDLLIIATARLHTALLITNEAKQLLPPRSMANFRIPAVCRHPDVKVPCCDFLDYLRTSSYVFG
jgi:predicted nucleic acid-binding protein